MMAAVSRSPRLVFWVLLTCDILPLARGFEVNKGRPLPFTGIVEGRITGNRKHQIYDLYLDPEINNGLFRDYDIIRPDRRSRLFVGKRIKDDNPYWNEEEDDDDEETEDGSDEEGEVFFRNGNSFLENELKRNHLFVGKRGSPKFVGRSGRGVLKRWRRKRQAPDDVENQRMNEELEEEANEVGMERQQGMETGNGWKEWMATEGGGNEIKRARMFVGKRPVNDQSVEPQPKRARLFVGRRAEVEEVEDGLIGERVTTGGSENAKRSRLFVGKRPDQIAEDGEFKSGGSGLKDISPEHPNFEDEFSAQRGSPRNSPLSSVEMDKKRVHMFPGKRPAPGFVGKRSQGQ